MRLIPPELTSAILTALTLGGTWFATWLARRGKKEDNRISERGQAFDEVLALADRRLTEITRLGAERDAATLREANAVTERERVRTSWEDRWDRQMTRCRAITEPLVATIGHLREGCNDATRSEADEALRALIEHNERDHTLDD